MKLWLFCLFLAVNSQFPFTGKKFPVFFGMKLKPCLGLERYDPPAQPEITRKKDSWPCLQQKDGGEMMERPVRVRKLEIAWIRLK